jgi:hypothetical protein
MSYAVCHTAISSLRSSSKERSELLSQVLFGEVMTIIDRKHNKWVRVLTHSDSVLGWILEDHIIEITADDFNTYKKSNQFSVELFHPLFSSNTSFHIPFGARLPGFDGLGFTLAGKRYTFSGRTIDTRAKRISGEWTSKVSKMFLHAPQLPGGRSPVGMDPASFVQMVFAAAGVTIERNFEDLVQLGNRIDFVEEAKEGDLALFEKRKGKVVHVGIILSGKQVIHVDGTVRVDYFDHYGIFNKEDQKYSHKLRIIRRVLLEDTPLDFSVPSGGFGKSAQQITMF